MASTLKVDTIAHTGGTSAMTMASNGTVSFVNKPTGTGDVIVNGLTSSAGATASSFETDLTGTALSGGAKYIKIYISNLIVLTNNYIHFSIKSADGYTDGGYDSAFRYTTGNGHYLNSGSGDANQAAKMSIGYYAGSYNIAINCMLIDPATNLWVMEGQGYNFGSNTANSGGSMAHSALGANKPITGFKMSSGSANQYNVTSMKYGYSYSV